MTFEIDEALQETDDPRFYDPEKPLLVARMAARKMDIAPNTGRSKQSSTPTQPTTPSKPARRERSQPLPSASGGSRTASVAKGTDLKAQIESIQTPEEFNRLMSAMKG